METVKTVFNDGKYSVVEFSGSSNEPIIITFDIWRGTSASLDTTESFATAFLRKYGFSYVCIKSARNDWYQRGVGPAIEAAKAIVKGRRCITYGASMGAYAAINFAADLGAERCIAFGPQFSIDGAKVPFEIRWREEASTLTFADDRISEPCDIPCIILYDPFTPEEVKQVSLIARTRNVTFIETHFSGHSVALFLRECGLLSKVSLALIADSFDLKEFRRELRARRPSVASAWHEASRIFQERGNHKLAAAFADVELRLSSEVVA